MLKPGDKLRCLKTYENILKGNLYTVLKPHINDNDEVDGVYLKECDGWFAFSNYGMAISSRHFENKPIKKEPLTYGRALEILAGK